VEPVYEELGGYPSSVTLDPDRRLAYVGIEGSGALLAVSLDDPGATLGLGQRSLRRTEAGPGGVALSGGRGWVHAAFEHAVQPFDAAAMAGEVEADTTDAPVDGWGTEDTWTIAAPTLSEQAERGRRLFTSTTNAGMSAPSNAVSCSTCHFDGRNDGLTWPLRDGPRQTPSLVGGLSETLPVTWTNGVQTIEDEVRLTSTGRMGGTGVTDEDRAAIAAYLETLATPDVPARGSADAAIARGKVLFEREDVGCATCHAGPAYTDHAAHDLFGLRGVDTPSLRGVAATAPYLHDGRYPTLSALLRKGDMGSTSILSDEELADLLAYVESL
jgi:cytochrome c peroxidase